MAVLKKVRLIGALSGSPGWYISPHGYNLYRTSAGDTFESLAQTYLGDVARASDIYNDQSPEWRSAHGNDPANLETGAELYMPQEAITAAIGMGLVDAGGGGEPPTAARSGKTEVAGTDVLKPSTPSNVVPIRPAPTPTPKTTPKTTPATPTATGSFFSKFGKAILIGGGLSVAVGTVAALVHHHKPAHRQNPKRRAKGFAAAWRAAEG